MWQEFITSQETQHGLIVLSGLSFISCIYICVQLIVDVASATVMTAKEVGELYGDGETEMGASVGGQGPFDHLPALKDARVNHPYREPQQPTPVKPTTRQMAEDKSNDAKRCQVYAMLDVADAIRELTDAVKEKNNA